MSFVVYFRAWIFSSVFFSRVGFWFLSLISGACFANTWGGLAKVLSLIVVPFLCVPNFAQIFPAALHTGDFNCVKNRKSGKTCKIFNWNKPREGTDGNEMKTGHLSISLLSVFWKEKAQPQTEGCLKITPACITSCTIYVAFLFSL